MLFQSHTPTRRVLATLGLITGLALTGCTTNEEQGHPDGWENIRPEQVEEIAALVPEDIATKGYLSMGTNPPYPPFEFKNSTGEIIGFEIDLANAMAAVMGLELRVVEQDFAMILPAVQAGTLDFGGSGFTDTQERRENFDFLNALYAGIQWAQTTGDNIDPDNPCGLRVAVQRTTVAETDDVRVRSAECVENGQEPIEILSYDTSDTAATALVLGRAQAFSADSPIISWAVERADGQIETTGEMFMAAPYGYALPKDSELLPAFAAAMQHLIDTGEYQQILHQWGITDGLIDQALINEEPVANPTAATSKEDHS